MERKEQERDRFAPVDILEEKGFPNFGFCGMKEKSLRNAHPFGCGKSGCGIRNDLMRCFRLKKSQCMQAFL